MPTLKKNRRDTIMIFANCHSRPLIRKIRFNFITHSTNFMFFLCNTSVTIKLYSFGWKVGDALYKKTPNFYLKSTFLESYSNFILHTA